MEISLIGIPQSGKTTIFNALTEHERHEKGKAESRAYRGSSLEPNIGVVKVGDSRLYRLGEIFKPKKITPAEIKYVDIALIPNMKRSSVSATKKGISSELLSYLERADALAQVVRAFHDERVPHPEGTIDPKRDIATIELELSFSDLLIMEKRLERLDESLKKVKPQEREQLHHEQDLLRQAKIALEEGIPLREQTFSGEDLKKLETYRFITAKPVVIILNIGEDEIPQEVSLVSEVRECCSVSSPLTTICGKLEMELAQINELEAKEFRSALGLGESAINCLTKLSYEALGLISFFTFGSDEVKAWTIHKGTTAHKAAGKIHSDIEKGFIRAEVINYDKFAQYGNMAEARKHGDLRLEGKDYIVQDGDLITFLFNL